MISVKATVVATIRSSSSSAVTSDWLFDWESPALDAQPAANKSPTIIRDKLNLYFTGGTPLSLKAYICLQNVLIAKEVLPPHVGSKTRGFAIAYQLMH